MDVGQEVSRRIAEKALARAWREDAAQASRLAAISARGAALKTEIKVLNSVIDAADLYPENRTAQWLKNRYTRKL